LATAQRFVDEGAHVFIVARRQEGLDEAVATIGKNVTPVQADFTKTNDLDRVYQTVKQICGHLDVVVANAGRGAFSPITEITEEHVDEVFDLNLKSSTVHGLEGAAFDARWRLDHHHFLDRGRERLSRSNGVRRAQSRTARCCASLDDRAKGQEDPEQSTDTRPVNTPRIARLPRERSIRSFPLCHSVGLLRLTR
jgi:NAD(P)-dependent dehydrogenase (short-subunit alcohol dehydrogenase family)